jgi:GNAT superfamily N-acetyltransferase
MSDIIVKPVTGKRELSQFIKFPWKIYEGNQFWVPPLLMDRRKLVDRKKNPFYKHSQAEFFLAYSNDEIVGRIAAIINDNHNKEHNENIGFFGFFECTNDQKVANALFNTAKKWLKEKGITAVRGPANPSVNDEYGLLIDGFDKTPVILMPYNPPYYAQLIEREGFQKIKDLYAYYLQQSTVYSEKLERVAQIVKNREGMSFRTLDMKIFDEELKIIEKLYNDVWQYNWGAVKMTEDEFKALAADLKPIVVPELVLIAEVNKQPIGFALSLPDINIALKYNKKGRLLPGFVRLLVHKKKIDGVRIIVLGVLKEHQKSGIAGVLFLETARQAKKLGYTWGEASWVLEDNVMMNRSAEMMNATKYKTYRIFECVL